MSNAVELAVVGGGMMGAAFVRGIVAAGVTAPGAIRVADISPERRAAVESECGVAVTAEAATAVQGARAVLLAIKPQVAADVLPRLQSVFGAGQLVISIMAGVTLERLRGLVGEGPALARVMPNIAATIRAGASAFACDQRVSAGQERLLLSYLEAVGTAMRVDERLMDAVTGLSGCGPAFVAVFLEALTDAGVAAGLPRTTAAELATQTVLGATRVCQTVSSPALLKDMVTSPGGATIAGLRALEAGGLRSAVIEAVMAATGRSKELGA